MTKLLRTEITVELDIENVDDTEIVERIEDLEDYFQEMIEEWTEADISGYKYSYEHTYVYKP